MFAQSGDILAVFAITVSFLFICYLLFSALPFIYRLRVCFQVIFGVNYYNTVTRCICTIVPGACQCVCVSSVIRCVCVYV